MLLLWIVEYTAVKHSAIVVCTDGLHIHKLGHFHDIVHGTRHDFYMNELRVEFILEWLALLERKGFDPAKLETSELGERMLKSVVF